MNKYCNSYLNKILQAQSITSPEDAQSSISQTVKEIRQDSKANLKEAIVAYSYLQIVGYKIEKKPIEAKERLNSMIQKQRCPEAMFFVAMAFWGGDLEYVKDKTKAEQLFRELAVSEELSISNEKKAISAHYVATIYNNGSVVTKDQSEAARFYELACQYGCPKSTLMLGKVYLSGAEGVFGTLFEKNVEKGLELLNKLAHSGNPEAKEEVVKYHLGEALNWVRAGGDSELMIASGIALDSLEWMLKE